MSPWKTLSRSVICQPNRFLSVEIHEIELPDGRRIPDWPWVVTPDYINVVAESENGQLICFRQTKYAVDGVSLAPVGGMIEPGEIPLDAAKRELLEETGYVSDHWMPLGAFPVDANRGAGTAHFFLARKARWNKRPTGDDLEEQQLVFLSKAEMESALDSGQFKVLGWTTAVALALRHLH